MKPAPFEYAAPETVDEALSELARDPDASSVLAGGQSLVPLLNMRLAAPTRLVDVNRVRELDRIDDTADGRVRLGATVRQCRLEREPAVARRLGLLSEAARYIAHPAIRSRGTVGGSLAHADPAAELPATACALDGRMVIRGPAGERTVPASKFFHGPLMSAVGPGELLTAVELEPPPPGSGHAFVEVARVHGAFAIAAVAAVLAVGTDGRIEHARLAIAGVGSTPYAPDWFASMAGGQEAGRELFDAVAERVRGEIEPYDDIHAPADYRTRVAGELVTRSLIRAATRARRAAELRNGGAL